MAEILDASIFVHIASLLYVLGFLVRDQLFLRLLVLLGTAFYIGYYYLAPDVPLWDAMAWSAILGAANVYIIVQLILERTTFSLSQEEKELFERFKTCSPGEFRKLLKIALWRSVTDPIELTAIHEPIDCLHYVLRGDLEVKKSNRCFAIPSDTFIGEVDYFLQNGASATVTLANGRLVSWHRKDLMVLERKNPGLRVALHALMTKDMANKIGTY